MDTLKPTPFQGSLTPIGCIDAGGNQLGIYNWITHHTGSEQGLAEILSRHAGITVGQLLPKVYIC